MLGFNHASQSPRNDLLKLATASGGLLSLFLLAGAAGHLTGVWPMIFADGGLQGMQASMMLLPGVVLAITALVNLFMGPVLWAGAKWAVRLALIVNVIAAIYFAYLLHRGIPGHPIGFFLAIVASQSIVLAAILLGLVWPAASVTGQPNSE